MYTDPSEEAKLQIQEAKAKASRDSTARQEKKKPTREEILERKMSMARERGSRVLKINSPLGNIMFNVLRQFDMAYPNFAGIFPKLLYKEGFSLQ